MSKIRRSALAILVLAAILSPMISMATSYCFTHDSGGTLVTGLVSYYPMEGNSNDFYTLANNGTDTSVSYATSTGLVVKGGSYNGATSQTTFANSSADGVPFSFCHDFNVQVKPVSGESVMMESGGASTGGWLSEFNSDGHLYTFLIHQSAIGISSAGISTNTWHQVCESADGSSQYMWFDGTLQTSASSSYSSGSPDKLIFGTDNDFTTTRRFNGYLDELGTWSKMLTATEVSDLWNGGSGDTMTNTCGGAGALPPATVWGTIFILGLYPDTKRLKFT